MRDLIENLERRSLVEGRPLENEEFGVLTDRLNELTGDLLFTTGNEEKPEKVKKLVNDINSICQVLAKRTKKASELEVNYIEDMEVLMATLRLDN